MNEQKSVSPLIIGSSWFKTCNKIKLFLHSSSNIPIHRKCLQALGTVLVFTLVWTISLMWNSSIANAAPNTVPNAAIDGSSPLDIALQAEVTRDEVNLVARDLWCPLCSGVRLDVCELKACDQMREEIAIQLADGASSEEITDYFLAQYGPQILGEPPRSGFNWLAWVVPVIALLAGGTYLLVSRRNASKRLSTVDGSKTAILPADAADTNPTISESEHGVPTNGQSDYERLLDKELESYD